jgi:hypothetical protein
MEPTNTVVPGCVVFRPRFRFYRPKSTLLTEHAPLAPREWTDGAGVGLFITVCRDADRRGGRNMFLMPVLEGLKVLETGYMWKRGRLTSHVRVRSANGSRSATVYLAKHAHHHSPTRCGDELH